MKIEILNTAEIVPAIHREVRRMAAAGEIKIEMEFSIAKDADFLELQNRIAALEKTKTKTKTTAPSASRFDAVNSK